MTDPARLASPARMSLPPQERRKAVVLMTGASGWLGQFVWQRFHQEYPQPVPDKLYFDNSGMEVYGTYANHKPSWIPPERARKMDVENEKDVVAVISELRPDVIVHLAAISFPNVCEKDPLRGERVNNPPAFINTVKIYCPQALLIFTSSALVYDGEHAPYKPDFDTQSFPPICAYGVSKLKAENAVLANMPKSVVLRLSNLLGPSFVYRRGEFKFMEWLYSQFKERKYLDFRYDEIRSFVYVNDVVDAIANIVGAAIHQNSECAHKKSKHSQVDLNRVYGQRFNVGGPRGLSRLDIAEMVARNSGVEVKIGNR